MPARFGATGGFRFRLEAVGEVHVERSILRKGTHALEAQLLFADLAEDLMNLEDEQFSSEGGFMSGGWPALAESTVARKGDATILFDTGDLKASLTQRNFQGERGGMILDINPTFLRFGTTDPVAGYHQRGHETPTPLPQRKVMELSEFWKQAMVKKVQLFIMRGELAAL